MLETQRHRNKNNLESTSLAIGRKHRERERESGKSLLKPQSVPLMAHLLQEGHTS